MRKPEEITSVGRRELARNDEVFFYNIHKLTTWISYFFAGVALTARIFLRQHMASSVFGLVTVFFATLFTFLLLGYPNYAELAFLDFEKWGVNMATFKSFLILTVPVLGIVQYLIRKVKTDDKFGHSLVFQWANLGSYKKNYEKVGKAYALWDTLLFLALGSLFYTTDFTLMLWFGLSALFMFREERRLIYYKYTRTLRNKAAAEEKQRSLGLGGASRGSGSAASNQTEDGIETRVMEVVSKKEQKQILKN